jgi:hypothetical protein
MPAEAARLYHRLGSRDRWFMLIVGLATAVVVVAILIAGRETSKPTATRCVGVKSAGFMGGINTEYCGTDATALCRSDAGRRSDLPEQCARLVPALRP